MAERVVSLRLPVIAGTDRENQRISWVAVVALVSLAHAVLFLLAVRGIEANHSAIVQPSPVSIRWVEAGQQVLRNAEPPPVSLVKPGEPSRPAMVPAGKPRRKIPLEPSSVRDLREGRHDLSALAADPSSISPTDARTLDAVQRASLAEVAPALTPPRVDAAYFSNPPPDYPLDARRARQEGTVLLRVLVAADGHSQDVSIERGCGFSQLDDSAAAAVRKWRFTPGRRGDNPVDAWVLIPISFKLRT